MDTKILVGVGNIYASESLFLSRINPLKPAQNLTKSEILDEQIVAIFKTLGPWTAGELDGKAVDTVLLFSFEIKKGVLELN